ncbi:MAG: hypothetical protein GY810_15025 [Aureispira sp.]|nr:hypothetical protein [Aureispira sp.]
METYFGGPKLLSKSEVAFKLDGAQWQYGRKRVQNLIASYNGGHLSPKIHDNALKSRMLKHAQNRFKDSDIINVSLRAQSVDVSKDQRWIDVIVATANKSEGTCSLISVSVWEEASNNSLQRFVPQNVTRLPYEIITKIQNVQ